MFVATLTHGPPRYAPNRDTMSTVASFALLRSAPGGRLPARRRDTRRAASINDKINEFKKNLPEVPKIDLPNVKVPKVDLPGGKSGGSGASPGYKPVGDADLYAGAGKYIPDDKEGFVSKTGRDSTLVGGFAGGEKGLWNYREVRLAEDPAARPKEWKRVYGGRKGTKEVDLSKDFGGLAGGFPGGEIGVKAYNATGNIATRDAPPTLGWGPPVLLLAALGAAGYYLNPGDPTEELGAVVAGASATKATIDNALTAEQQTLGLEVALGLVAAVAVANALGSLAKKAGAGLVDAGKLALLGAATLAVAGKVLDLY